MKKSRKRVLCKIQIKHCKWTFYRDGTYKTQYFTSGEYREWVLGHCEFGPMFIYRNFNDQWATRWKSNDPNEITIATTIARALADLEVEKMLKGE